MREGTIAFRLGFIDWEFLEAGVSTDARDQKISSSKVVDGFETEAGNFVRNTSFDGEPLELF